MRKKYIEVLGHHNCQPCPVCIINSQCDIPLNSIAQGTWRGVVSESKLLHKTQCHRKAKFNFLHIIANNYIVLLWRTCHSPFSLSLILLKQLKIPSSFFNFIPLHLIVIKYKSRLEIEKFLISCPLHDANRRGNERHSGSRFTKLKDTTRGNLIWWNTQFEKVRDRKERSFVANIYIPTTSPFIPRCFFEL